MASTQPTCSGVFFRFHCRHQQLFEKEYKRSNRNRGTKILRCFPHCCPSHVERSYCGSSLELAVEMHQPIPVDAQSLFVFARFETVDLENPLVVGEQCSLRYLQSVSQSEANPEATWIQGSMQNGSSSHSSKTTRVFLLNGQTSSKWYYHWESGANKARRLTQHVLKAYIVYRRPGTAASSQDFVQVISTVSSPPFTLVSYRRSAWEGLEGMEGGNNPTEEASKSGGGGGGYDLHQIVQDQISLAFQDFQAQPSGDATKKPRYDPQVAQSLRLRAESVSDPNAFRDSMQETEDGSSGVDDNDDVDCACESCDHYRRARPPVVNVLVRDQWTWERQHTAMLLHMKDLAVIYYFVSHIPMGDAMQSFRVREHVYAALQQHWCGEGGATSGLQPATLLALLFPGRDGKSSGGFASTRGLSVESSAAVANPQVENLFLIVTKLSIWMLTSETVQLFKEFFELHASVLLHKRRLRDAFLHFAGILCKRIHVFWSREVAAASGGASGPHDTAFKAIRTLSEHIISLSHVHPRFQAMWPDLREILESPSTMAWENFVSQMRETFLRKEPTRRHRIQCEPGGLAASATTQFSGSWAVDASSTSIDRPADASLSSAARGLETVSITAALLAMVQLQQLHIRVVSKDTLLIRSESSLLPDANPWMALVCDDSPRTASALPLGLSSLVGSGYFGGDYVGAMRPKRSSVQVEFYWWPLRNGKSRRAYATSCHATRVIVTLHADHDAAEPELQATLEVQQGAIAKSQVERERLTRLDLCSPKERVAMSVGWVPLWRVLTRFTSVDSE